MIRFFENLTVFPQLDVCKQLNSCSLFYVSMLSKKWEQIVKMREMTTDCIWEIIMSKNALMIHLNFKDETQDFRIGFKEDQDSKRDFEHNDRCNWICFRYKTAHQLEESSFKALQLLSHLFPPIRYHRITVQLGPRCPDFPFRFLSKLPRAPAKYVDLQADQEVECADLTTFLDVIVIPDSYGVVGANKWDLKVRVKNLAPSDKITIRNEHLRIPDARFLTHESIQKLDIGSAEIGENNFTSQDFNAFFRSWMTKEKDNKYNMNIITFDIREDQKINMEEVMEGLSAHVGKPRLRDRWRVYVKREMFDVKFEGAFDCDKGWDIISDRDVLGTVLLEPQRLLFIVFVPRFDRDIQVTLLERCIRRYRESINYMRDRQKELERKVAAEGANACLTNVYELNGMPESIKNREKRLEESMLDLEKLKLCNND